jgi:two-component system response regulator AlgR
MQRFFQSSKGHAGISMGGEIASEILTVPSHRGVDWVCLADIRCFVAEQKYVRVLHLHGSLLLRTSLKNLETAFGERFVRIHRNTLVSLPHVLAVDRKGVVSHVRIEDSKFSPRVSRRALVRLRERLRAACLLKTRQADKHRSN